MRHRGTLIGEKANIALRFGLSKHCAECYQRLFGFALRLQHQSQKHLNLSQATQPVVLHREAAQVVEQESRLRKPHAVAEASPLYEQDASQGNIVKMPASRVLKRWGIIKAESTCFSPTGG